MNVSGEFADQTVEIDFDLQIYDAILINTAMCTADCPCADVSTKNQWLSLTSEELKQNWPTRLTGFNFSGTYTSYNECIENV